MFSLYRGKAKLEPLCSESDYLEFLNAFRSTRNKSYSLSEILNRYVLRFLVPSVSESSSLEIAYSYWDIDPPFNSCRLVAASPVALEARDYPRELRLHEGIVGNILAKYLLDKKFDRQRSIYVSCDYSHDPYLANATTIINKLGYRSGIAFPLYSTNRLHAIFKLYCSCVMQQSTARKVPALYAQAQRLTNYIELAQAVLFDSIRNTLAERFLAAEAALPPTSGDALPSLLADMFESFLYIALEILDGTRAVLTVHENYGLLAPTYEKTRPIAGAFATNDKITKDLYLGRVDGARRLGTLSIEQKTTGTFFSNLDKALFDTYADVFTQYMQKLLDALSTRAQVDRAVDDGSNYLLSSKNVSQELLRCTSREAIVERLLEEIHKSYSIAAVVYLEVSERLLIPLVSLPKDLAERLTRDHVAFGLADECPFAGRRFKFPSTCAECRACSGVTAVCALLNRTVSVENLRDEKLAYVYYDCGVPATTEMVVPLSLPNRVIGVVDIYRNERHGFSKAEQTYIQTLCNVASLALYNCHLQHELAQINTSVAFDSMARDVVHSLLPHISTFRIEFGALMRQLHDVHSRHADKEYVRTCLRDAMRQTAVLLENISHQHNELSRYRTKTQRIDAEKKSVSLRSIIDDVVQMHAFQAQERRIQFKIVEDGREVLVWAFEHDVYMIIWNIVNNAVKFTSGSRSTTVSISICYEATFVIVRIRDEGRGIAPDVQKRVWELGFSQKAPGSHQRTSGIGLFTVANLVNAMKNSDVSFTSAPGRGTEFVLQFGEIQ